MKLIHAICASSLAIIGVVHIAFGAFTFETVSEDLLWFSGAGLSLIFIGFINFLFRSHPGHITTYVFTQISNFLFLVLVVLMDLVAPMLPGFIGLVAILLLLAITWKFHAKASNALKRKTPQV